MSGFGVGNAGSIGRIGASASLRNATSAPVDFSVSNTTATTQWGTVVIGELTPINAPDGAYFVLVNEPAGIAITNG